MSTDTTILDHQMAYMKMAVDLSEQALLSGHGGPFGAIIVRDREVIGSSGNCVFQNTDPTSHAEIMAIRDACNNIQSQDLSGCSIYSSAEPCPMCMAAIYWARIEAVFFSNTEHDSLKYGFIDTVILDELRKDPADRAIQSTRILHPHAIEVFRKAREMGVAKTV
ncbi:MAG TPA: nucleoside deaminase [Puia sp.]|jgi:tRNA(Arg) A34 adenosine deaminase TadA|nr:nucleoside deaminase [Puia sp.]